MAKLSFFLSLVPLSLGTTVISLLSISLRAKCSDNIIDLPTSFNSPEKGTSKPILS